MMRRSAIVKRCGVCFFSAPSSEGGFCMPGSLGIPQVPLGSHSATGEVVATRLLVKLGRGVSKRVAKGTDLATDSTIACGDSGCARPLSRYAGMVDGETHHGASCEVWRGGQKKTP
jgi:hypothetical protein